MIVSERDQQVSWAWKKVADCTCSRDQNQSSGHAKTWSSSLSLTGLLSSNEMKRAENQPRGIRSSVVSGCKQVGQHEVFLTVR